MKKQHIALAFFILPHCLTYDAFAQSKDPIGVYRLENESLILQKPYGHVSTMRFDPTGRYLACLSNDQIGIHDIRQRVMLDAIRLPKSYADISFLSPRFLSMTTSQKWMIYDIRRSAFLKTTALGYGNWTHSQSGKRVFATQYQLDSRQVYSGQLDSDGNISMTLRCKVRLEDAIACMAACPEDRYLAIATYKHLQLIDLKDGSLVKRLILPVKYMNKLWLSDQGRHALFESGVPHEEVIEVLDIQSGRRTKLSDRGELKRMIGFRDADTARFITKRNRPANVKITVPYRDRSNEPIQATTFHAYNNRLNVYAGATQGDLILEEENGGTRTLIHQGRTRPFLLLGKADSQHAIYLQVGPEMGHKNYYKLDLETGNLTDISERSSEPTQSALIYIRDNPLDIDDLRDRVATVQMDGLPKTRKLFALETGMVSKPLRIVSDGQDLYMLDLSERRVIAHLKRSRSAAPVSRFAFAQPLIATNELILIDSKSSIMETWDVKKKVKIAEAPYPLGEGQRVKDAYRHPTTKRLYFLWGTELYEIEAIDKLDIKKMPSDRRSYLIGAMATPDGRLIRKFVSLFEVIYKISKPSDPQYRPVTFRSHLSYRHKCVFMDNAGLILVYQQGYVTIRASDGRHIADLYMSDENKPIFISPDGYYMAAPEALNAIIEVRQQVAGNATTFDRTRNHPGLILQRLGVADRKHTQYLNALRQSRLANRRISPAASDLKPLPLVSEPPIRTKHPSIQLPFASPARGLDSIQILLNGIPLYTEQGRSLNTNHTVIDLPLGPGRNTITIYGLAEKKRVTAVHQYVTDCDSVFSPGRIYFLGIGVSKYKTSNYDLKYAARDIQDVAAALNAVNDDVKSLLLLDGHATKSRLTEATHFLSKARIQDTVMIYMAGHGLLSKDQSYRFMMHDSDFNHPESGLSIKELEGILQGVKSGSRWIFLDSCHSGANDRPINVSETDNRDSAAEEDDISNATMKKPTETLKGERGAKILDARQWRQAADARLHSFFSELSLSSQATVVAAASARQFAFERNDLANGVFSHFFIRSLREGLGRDADGQLRLSGAMKVIQARASEMTNGAQNPNIKRSAFGFDFPIVGPRRMNHEIMQVDVGYRKNQISVAEDGKLAAVLGSDKVAVVNLKDRKLLASQRLTDIDVQDPSAANFSADGRYLWLNSRNSVSYTRSDDLTNWRQILKKDRINKSIAIKPKVFGPDGWMIYSWEGKPHLLRLGADLNPSYDAPIKWQAKEYWWFGWCQPAWNARRSSFVMMTKERIFLLPVKTGKVGSLTPIYSLPRPQYDYESLPVALSDSGSYAVAVTKKYLQESGISYKAHIINTHTKKLINVIALNSNTEHFRILTSEGMVSVYIGAGKKRFTYDLKGERINWLPDQIKCEMIGEYLGYRESGQIKLFTKHGKQVGWLHTDAYSEITRDSRLVTIKHGRITMTEPLKQRK